MRAVRFTNSRISAGVIDGAASRIIATTPAAAGDAMLAENVEFDIQDGSSIQVVCVQDWAPGAIQYSAHFATVGKDASFTHIVV
ncbi:MAG: SufD family Fe-S cluster assembly protein, partial [Pontimonas sp.]|nr:SufD family Fe-S cluster assembly protein [Pontimonas sp.]